MHTEDFLRRVIPGTGNYATMGFVGNGGFFQHRSYPIDVNTAAALANAIAYWSGQGVNVYHALASFTLAEQKTTKNGSQYTAAERKAANAHSLKVIIVDCDVVHAGTKIAGKAYADRNVALAWVKAFVQATGIPRPNIVIDSGNGFHLYWTLETPLPVAQWQPLAEAMKAAILANGFIGDAGCTADAARVLRPPGSVNLKSGQPVPVQAIDALTLPDYPNSTLITALGPWMGQQQTHRATGTHGKGASVQGLGPRPKDLPPPDPALGPDAVGGERLPYRFANVSKRCLQAKLTLERHGADQTYEHWRKADLPLLAHCVDGERYVHPISDGYSGYTQAETDRQYADAKNAVENRGVGPPLCESYNHYRSNVCDKCPWSGKVKTPLTLGLDDPCFPVGRFRQNTNPVQLEMLTKDGWERVVAGAFANPHLVELITGGHEITVDYTRDGKTWRLSVKDAEIKSGQDMLPHFAHNGITCEPRQAHLLGAFFVAWIDKLRTMGQVEPSGVVSRAFGWNMVGPEYTGVAIGGDLYGPKGMSRLAVTDKKMASIYRPMGTLAAWRKAAALFEGTHARPDLQGVIACSFASVLIALTSDIRGMTLNFWSAGSGVGKSTAIRVGQSVWGDYAAMQSMEDTANAVMKSLSGPRILVRYWDEFRYPRDKYPEFVRLIYTIPQGKERMRMQSDTSLRDVGEWEALLVLGSNRAWVDVVVQYTDGTDSGVLRLLDVPMSKVQLPFDPKAGTVIKAVETNYGWAGREYARYLGTHTDQVREALVQTLDWVTKDLGMQQEERYYATALATVRVGTTIARQLGLFDFQVEQVYGVLKDAVLAGRATRANRVVVTQAGKYDVGHLVSSFVNAMGDARLKTETQAVRGGAPVKIVTRPRFTDSVKVHIVGNPAVIRMHRSEFQTWLHRQGLPYSQVFSQMQADWPQTRESKITLGAGTEYTGGQLWCVEVPRGDPMLEDIFFMGDRP
jgi:hypothetical protein